MKKYSLYICLAWSLVLASCKSALEISEVESLELSVEEQIQIRQEGQSLEVGVSTNLADWSYLGGSPWLNLSKSGNNLILKGEVNESLHKRQATVVVRAGQLARTINVVQMGKGQILDAGEQTYQFDQWGKEIAFVLESDLNDLEVINSSSEWVKYEMNHKKKEFRIVVAENKAYEPRRATLYLRDTEGNGNSKIVIEQQGAMYHLLPYGGFNQTEDEIKAFELDRRSILIGKPTGVANPLIGGNTNIWTYETQSKAFNVIQYIVEPDERRYRSAIIWATDPRLFTQEKEQEKVIEFLLREGFELRRNSTYYSKKHECQALVGVSAEGSFIMYTFEPIQPKPLATFAKFPWGIVADEQWRSYDDDKVRLWEEAHGGTYVMEKDNNELRTVVYSTEEYGGHLRVYVFNDNNYQNPLESVQQVFTDINPILFYERGASVLTREFLELARGEQFEFDRYLDAYIFLFQHKARSLYLGAYRTLVQDLDDETKEFIVAKLEFMSTQPPMSSSIRKQRTVSSREVNQNSIIQEAIHRAFKK
ncbi:MAG: BACON domain-containing protein [Porphyromonadaceae bacterium]|nr:BACON domain-containing protein [Porphyromonadaceae bacterium]